MTFNINKYQVIKKAISYELANFIFNYFMLKREAISWMYDNNIIYDTGMFGTWSDKQVPNTYSHYADMVMETLMMKVLPRMQQETNLKLGKHYFTMDINRYKGTKREKYFYNQIIREQMGPKGLDYDTETKIIEEYIKQGRIKVLT